MRRDENGKLIPDVPIEFLEDPDALLLTIDAAKFLGTTQRYLSKLRSTGGGPEFVRISPKKCGYTRRALVDWVKKRAYRSTSHETVKLKAVPFSRS
jgi:hypothetical protein